MGNVKPATNNKSRVSKKREDEKNTQYFPSWSDPVDRYSHISRLKLSPALVKEISGIKAEPEWMLRQRLEALAQFQSKSLPSWGPDLSLLNFDNFHYFLKPTDSVTTSWAKVPSAIKNTFTKLGLPQAEQLVLSGVKAQYDSEVVYGSLHDSWKEKGVVFLSMDEGLKLYPDLVKQYFGKLVPSGDNKFAALNSAVWSGGSFVYVPKGVKIKLPLQTYFRINANRAGQFERTLIIVDEGASVHYVEGCTAPVFSQSSLHSAVVEVFVKKGGRCQYTTVQNWYKNVYNLVTKRAWVEAEGVMIWTDFNLGSKVTVKYPSLVLAGKGAKGETLSMALAGSGQRQDTGSKAIHLAPHTSSTIVSKSISKDGGRTSYRGLVNVGPKAHHSQNSVVCDALILDEQSRSDTYPTQKIFQAQANVQHEATVSKVGEDQLFYLISRGISEEDARKMIVNGFISELVRTLPLEYAVEMNRLIECEMEGNVG